MQTTIETTVAKLTASGPLMPVYEAWRAVVGRPLPRRTRDRIVRSGQLASLIVTGQRMTTEAAVREFLARTNEATP